MKISIGKFNLYSFVKRFILTFLFFNTLGVSAQIDETSKDTLNFYFGSSFRFFTDNIYTQNYNTNFSMSYLFSYEKDINYKYAVVGEMLPFKCAWSNWNGDSLAGEYYDDISFFSLGFDFGLLNRIILGNEKNYEHHYHFIDIGVKYNLPVVYNLRLKQSKTKYVSNTSVNYNDIYFLFRYYRSMVGYSLEYHPFSNLNDNRFEQPYTFFIGIDIFINDW